MGAYDRWLGMLGDDDVRAELSSLTRDEGDRNRAFRRSGATPTTSRTACSRCCSRRRSCRRARVRDLLTRSYAAGSAGVRVRVRAGVDVGAGGASPAVTSTGTTSRIVVRSSSASSARAARRSSSPSVRWMSRPTAHAGFGPCRPRTGSPPWIARQTSPTVISLAGRQISQPPPAPGQ